MDVPVNLFGIAPQLIKAASERAKLLAGLLGKMIESSPDRDLLRSGCTPFLLLELGAAAQLADWENSGLSVHIDEGLPSFDDAKRCIVDPELPRDGFPGWRPGESLSLSVFRLTSKRVSWHSQAEWGIDIVLGEPDEEELLDAAVEALWNLHGQSA